MERITVAIAAVDVFNYTVLLDRDEAGTLAALDRLRRDHFEPLVGSGRLFRVLGDGSLFEFPEPSAAVDFAIALQVRLRRTEDLKAAGEKIRLRVGVDFGEVIFDGRDLHGETVNTASRLEAMAPVGGVCISQRVHECLGAEYAWQFAPLGSRRLKGITAPVPVWRWPQGVDPAVRRRDPAAEGAANGRQILDPKVTELLLVLHMRSARLAVSDAIDEILHEPDEGRALPQDELFRKIGAKLNITRELLAAIGIQCIDDVGKHMRSEPQTAMSTFMANVFDSAQTAYVFPLLNEIGGILQSGDSAVVRRRAIMAVVDRFTSETMIPRMTALIKFAFVEA